MHKETAAILRLTRHPRDGVWLDGTQSVASTTQIGASTTTLPPRLPPPIAPKVFDCFCHNESAANVFSFACFLSFAMCI